MYTHLTQDFKKESFIVVETKLETTKVSQISVFFDGDDNTIMILVRVTWTWPISQTSGTEAETGLEDF